MTPEDRAIEAGNKYIAAHLAICEFCHNDPEMIVFCDTVARDVLNMGKKI